MNDILNQLNDAAASLLEGAARSLVHVQAGATGGGAGTIWHSDGLVLTNAHVAHHDIVQVRLQDGRSLSGRVVASDVDLDLAAITVDALGLPTIEPGASRSVVPGQFVMALGHPWGVSAAATAGTVIGLEAYRWSRSGDWREFLAVNLRLRPGNSGGPLLDSEGRLIGINTIMNGEQTGLAVPVHVVKRFLKDSLGEQRRAQPPVPVPHAASV